jgi:hypothetical protein
MIDMSKETVFGLCEAAKYVPRTSNRPVHHSTIWRWCRVGIRGVKVEHLMVGSRCVTSREALNRFFQKLSELPPASAEPDDLSPPLRASKRTPARRRSDVDRAKADLASAGI